jgi:hypothetical protein
MKRVNMLLAAAGALGLSTQAFAATVDLGEIPAEQSVGGSLSFSGTGAEVADSWSFTLTQDLNTAIVFDSADLDGVYGIADFLVASAAAADMSFDYSAEDNSYSFTGLLPAGTYQIDVSGTTSGALGGGYDMLVGASAAAVPLPAPLGLFASGIFALGALRRRSAAG